MNHFTMNPTPAPTATTPTPATTEATKPTPTPTPTTPTPPTPGAATHPLQLATDGAGCLYDIKARELAQGVPDDLRAGFEAMAAVRLAGRLMHLGMERWADRFGLSDGRMQAMFRLLKSPDNRLAMSELATELNVSPRNITGLIDHLERDGLVARQPDPIDRRSIQAVLTPEGRRLMSGLWRDTIARQAPVARQFTEDELATLRELCLRLVKYMSEAQEDKR